MRLPHRFDRDRQIVGFRNWCGRESPSAPPDRGRRIVGPGTGGWNLTARWHMLAAMTALIYPTTNFARTEQLNIVRGDGIYVFDASGKRYLEGLAGLWCSALGYGNRELIGAITEQLEQLSCSHMFGGRTHRVGIELAERLAAMLPIPDAKIFLANSMARAVGFACKTKSCFCFTIMSNSSGNCSERILLRHPMKKSASEPARKQAALLLGLAFGLVLAGCGPAEQGERVEADLILTNGKVLTVDENFSIHDTVVVDEGLIIATGGAALLQSYSAPDIVDLQGKLLMPGFIDSHTHIRGRPNHYIDLTETGSVIEIRQLVRAKAEEVGAGNWVTGYGWSEDQLAEGRRPPARRPRRRGAG